MERITKIESTQNRAKKKLRVAAYARVSTDSAEQLVSLNAQKEHYERYIKSNPRWEYAGIYYDEGITGTNLEKRDGLLRLISDCENGLIDYIIVKSISRFSRNTVDSLETVRHLFETVSECPISYFLKWSGIRFPQGLKEQRAETRPPFFRCRSFLFQNR